MQFRWRVIPQMILVSLVTLLLGTLIAGTIIDATGPTLDDLGPLWLLNVLPGVLGGVFLGALLRPTRRQLGPYLGLAAVVEAATNLVLLLIATSRVTGPGLDPVAVIPGLALTVGVLVLVAGVLWWWKSAQSDGSVPEQG